MAFQRGDERVPEEPPHEMQIVLRRDVPVPANGEAELKYTIAQWW